MMSIGLAHTILLRWELAKQAGGPPPPGPAPAGGPGPAAGPPPPGAQPAGGPAGGGVAQQIMQQRAASNQAIKAVMAKQRGQAARMPQYGAGWKQ